MNNCIDYKRIARAIDFYIDLGYLYGSALWTAPAKIIKKTLPKHKKISRCSTLTEPLIGSGEQHFIHLIDKGIITYGKHCCVTPCFRDDTVDDIHNKYFMKVELISVEYMGLQDILHTVQSAQMFFASEGVRTSIVPTHEKPFCYDLLCSGTRIELGSYGYGEHNGFRYAYGTGLAEPRFSVVKNKLDNQT